MLRRAKIAATILTLALAGALPAQADDRSGGPGGVLGQIIRAVKGETGRIDAEAMHAYKEAPRNGSCEDRRARILALLPDALQLARLARDIGEDKHAAKMRSEGLATLDLGGGRTAHFQANGRRYAEVVIDEPRKRVSIIFQGTRLAVQSDVSTDIISFIGLKSGYHRWAAALVAQVMRDHPGMEVVVSGHSLGGGLAIYAVLQNPGVKGVVFNPAGVALLTWAQASREERARTSAAVTVISTRSDDHIEPVTAVSLSGRSVLPGHILVLETDAHDPVSLHSSSTVVRALERVEETAAAGSVCEGDLGELVD